ncbi:MAG: sulfite exporter TauE/SafE family protein [Caldilineaceae bacterium]|nr:sulfite exporter TauE/SafE family protein [Caldilineaceae bacterium]
MSADGITYVLAILAGVLAGIINTLAGSGSIVTLPMLVFLGLSPSVANGTNRVGVIVQNIVGIATFRQQGQLQLEGGLWLTVPAMIGAVLGAQIAVNLNEQAMNLAIGIVMVVMLFVVLFNPKQWMRVSSNVQSGRPSIWILGIFFVIGIYGGFIQAGVGVFLLVALVMGVGYSMVHANAIKLMIVLALSLAAIVVFINNDQVDWGLGVLMAIGQSIGAWLAARYASNNPNANIWVRRLLIAVILVSIAKFFGLMDLAGRLMG